MKNIRLTETMGLCAGGLFFEMARKIQISCSVGFCFLRHLSNDGIEQTNETAPESASGRMTKTMETKRNQTKPSECMKFRGT